VSRQMFKDVLMLRHSRSTKVLSMQRPLPSMLIITSCRFSVPVKSSLVNWLLLRGNQDARLPSIRVRKCRRMRDEGRA
jgi:hypothetical protein